LALIFVCRVGRAPPYFNAPHICALRSVKGLSSHRAFVDQEKQLLSWMIPKGSETGPKRNCSNTWPGLLIPITLSKKSRQAIIWVGAAFEILIAGNGKWLVRSSDKAGECLWLGTGPPRISLYYGVQNYGGNSTKAGHGRADRAFNPIVHQTATLQPLSRPTKQRKRTPAFCLWLAFVHG